MLTIPENKWIFCHRGYWTFKDEENKPIAVMRAYQNGFASEIDIYPVANRIYVSHDEKVANLENEIGNFNIGVNRYALNIKSDGMIEIIKNYSLMLEENQSFFFDGSIPEIYRYRIAGLPHALRLSEYEKELPWDTKYLWVDGFHSDWWLEDLNILKLSEKHEVIFVSPELHGRKPDKAWDWIAKQRKDGNRNLSICTDNPTELLYYFS